MKRGFAIRMPEATARASSGDMPPASTTSARVSSPHSGSTFSAVHARRRARSFVTQTKPLSFATARQSWSLIDKPDRRAEEDGGSGVVAVEPAPPVASS